MVLLPPESTLIVQTEIKNEEIQLQSSTIFTRPSLGRAMCPSPFIISI